MERRPKRPLNRHGWGPLSREHGLALVITVIALCLFSLLGLYLALNSATELRISDNYESHIRARFAALGGLEHSRDLLRGLDFNDLLKGPDGAYDTSAGYLNQARAFTFRNPISWAAARSLDIADTAGDVAGMPDDGLVNTGKYGSMAGTLLIPSSGIAQTVANPYGTGTITISRYFVKVSDNNGEPSEIAGDGANNPFFDGDGIIIVRSVGVAGTIRENTTGRAQRNAVAAFESRFKRYRTFQLNAALVVQGIDVQAAGSVMFEGTAFRIQGGPSNPGIGTIDVNAGDAISPASQISSALAPDQFGNIQGMALNPSVQDITGPMSADSDKSLLLNKDYLWNFTNNTVLRFADNVFQGPQNWIPGVVPNLGTYDPALPWNDPGQYPKVTLVNGDLSVSGNIRGGGLLVVNGRLTVDGAFMFTGLILIVGRGELVASGMNPGVRGGIYMAGISDSGGILNWGSPKLTLSRDSYITFDNQAVEMAVRLIPPSQVSFREVTSAMDP